jgi:hypothetical protein
VQKTFDISAPVEVEVRLTSGEVEIDTTSGVTQIEVELIAHDEESQQLVDEARIDLHDGAGRPRLTVDVPQRRSGGFNFGFLFGRQGITCRVKAPEGSGLQVRTKSADVTARGRLGGLNVSSASGDVVADHVDGGVSVKSASGDVSVHEVDGGLNIQTASGDVDVDTARGPVSIATASGDVSIGEAYDNVSANTVSGDQHHGAVMRGTVSAHSVSGDVQIAVRRGSKVFLDCSTVSGDTSSELGVSSEAPAGDGPMLEIRAKTVSGDIVITRAPAPTPSSSDSAQEVHA